MRAFDLMVFMICINLAIGFVNTVMTTGDQKTFFQPNKGEGWTYNITDHSEMTATNTTPISGTLEMTKWMIGGMMFFVSMLGSIVYIEPALEHTFLIPQAISIVLQTLVWIIYVAGIVQWYTNRPFKAYD